MPSPRRHAKLEKQLCSLEAEFGERLVTALRSCAPGRWGLFGQNERVMPKELPTHLASPDAPALLELGERIGSIRRRLGITEDFALYDRLVRMRALCGANNPGEPRLAREWLEEIEVS